ncbi:unnamed protein product [Lampetra planeri]
MGSHNRSSSSSHYPGGQRRKRGGRDPEEEESAAKRRQSMEMDHKHSLCMRTVVFGVPDERTATKPAAPRHKSRSPLRVRCSVDEESIGSRMCTVSSGGGGEQGRGCRVVAQWDPLHDNTRVWSRLGASGAPPHTTSGPEGHRWQRLSVVPPVTTRAESAECRAPLRNISQEPSTWYQITIPFGRKYGKEGLLQFLQQGCCTSFTPLQFHFEGDMATFYVVNYMAALNLKALSRKIVFPDNYRAIVLMRPVLGPPPPLAAGLTKDDRRLIEAQPPTALPHTAQPPTALPPTPLPPTSADIQGLIANFLKEYYGLYDTADREGLLKKYHKDALITIYTPSESSLGEEGTDKPTPEDSPQLKCERLTAEDFIKELTHKHHDMSSFTTTVSRGTNTQVNFTVHGFFKETKNCQESVKMFWRVVQLVPTMDGRPSVASERMFIREALASEMPPAFASTTSATSSSCPLTVLTSSQQEIVNSFAEKSHMTPKWSQRCLERNNWDFSKAADYFIHLDEAGKIPGEAFL